MLRGVSFAARPGCLLHVHGPNGTGKTTLLRVLCGLLRPESGVVRWGGEAIETIRSDYQRTMTYASHEAALWLLDEPYTNLDAKGGELLTALLDRHVGAGGIALVVAHHALPLTGAIARLELAA